MTVKERFAFTINHKEADRIPICDTVWETTVARWHKEELPEDKSSHDYFGYDSWVAIGADISLQLTPETIEDRDEHSISRNSDDTVTKY